ncbi:hypothetical protein A2761_02590 [Candidatus Kaiserbacteria bacterium RIFCSPHIGHO2_01_FULL_51_33]|uniref:Uncharacterized protein n=1 Tax=Candidatus Kaiserbacteria bacterium RIFCSPLOWO2_01_FULL_51_21 TaxID=1798508 RepID=A0A1F6EDE1_9BACT|nr:MAG: hypothetical protein A2761_02590 [Candidatus Kaiserbacteria bacterium RIFCSPHIGHO2_01_FULL_51_33]OGG71666.1 MAG: hypothetical protein A3A35_00680 [Candidatus Kaiserbacteria bacterium RIFCSPLOWO2_01_FULL_51_21]
MDETQQLIKERLAQVPKEIKDAINAVDLRPRLQNIAKKYQLHVDQAGALENETLFVMLGLESPNDFTKTLTRELDIPPAQAQLITGSVNEEIFLPIREALRRMFEEDAKVDAEQELANAPEVFAPQTTVGALGRTKDIPQISKIPEVPPELTIERKKLLREIEELSTAAEPQVPELRIEQKKAEVPANLPTGTIAETKLLEMFRLPRENVQVKQESGIGNQAMETAQKPKQPQTYTVDPYKEPIE